MTRPGEFAAIVSTCEATKRAEEKRQEEQRKKESGLIELNNGRSTEEVQTDKTPAEEAQTREDGIG